MKDKLMDQSDFDKLVFAQSQEEVLKLLEPSINEFIKSIKIDLRGQHPSHWCSSLLVY